MYFCDFFKNKSCFATFLFNSFGTGKKYIHNIYEIKLLEYKNTAILCAILIESKAWEKHSDNADSTKQLRRLREAFSSNERHSVTMFTCASKLVEAKLITIFRTERHLKK